MSKFLPICGFKWRDPKEFDLHKYTSNSWKGCILKADLEYLKELSELHNDCPLAPDKIEIKREMLSNYQLKIADFYNIPIGNVKKLVHSFIDKEKVCAALWELATLLETRIKTKKNTLCIRIQSITMAKAICWIQHTHKKIEAEKNSGEGGWKRWKSVVPKLMNNAVYGQKKKKKKKNGKLEKYNWCETREQQKILPLKMDIKTKLLVTKTIWQ